LFKKYDFEPSLTYISSFFKPFNTMLVFSTMGLDIHKLGDYSRIGEESLNRAMRLVELGGQQKLKIL